MKSSESNAVIKVMKRNGNIVPYDGSKIILAITKAFIETGYEESIAMSVAEAIEEDIFLCVSDEEPNDIEDIQNMIEDRLMDRGCKPVAKAYILYRAKQAELRESKPKADGELLTDDFISKYKHLPNPFPNPFAEIVFYRTYSRFLPEESRREKWYETCRRAVEYNCSLAPTTREEAEQLFDNMYHLRQFLSGRTIFAGGTEVSKKFPLSNFNCCFSVVDSIKTFSEATYLLLLGCGYGFRILQEDVDKLPMFKKDIEIIHQVYTPVPKGSRKEYTGVEFHGDTIAIITVGDSKVGWVKTIEYYFEIMTTKLYTNIDTIVINYDNVRPFGEKLKTFGGSASGHTAILTILDKIHKFITRRGESQDKAWFKIEPIDCLDIQTSIAEGIVVGGTRRSASIGLGSLDDVEFVNAKQNLYTQDEDGYWVINQDIINRQLSNNTILFYEQPTREQLHEIIQNIRKSSEPGLCNAEEALRRNPHFKGMNPCFTGDMKLLTVDGYKRFDELEDQQVEILNKDGEISNGKIWCSGNKPTVEIKFLNRSSITCTEDHVFMLNDGTECMAKDLKNHRIMPYLKNPQMQSILISQAPVVVNVIPTGKIERVYDFNEPTTHWGVVEGVIAHNCGEILLDSEEVCNLVTQNMMAFVDEEKCVSIGDVEDAFRLATRASMRMTCVDLELSNWDTKLKRDRLIGVSLTGWQDMVNATELPIESQKQLLSYLKQIVHEEAELYAKELGINEPLLKTCVKPEGTLSQLPTVSSGVHFSHSPYYLRRVRMNAIEPLVEVCKELGYKIYNEVGQSDEDCKTKVIEFPIKAPEGKTKYDVSAIEQLEIYKMFMEEFTDFNTSITVHVRENEWDDVEEWVWDNWDSMVGISFIPLDDSFYELLPYESITKEQYDAMIAEMKPFNASLIEKYEKIEMDADVVDDTCIGGCPVR